MFSFFFMQPILHLENEDEIVQQVLRDPFICQDIHIKQFVTLKI